jgi:hypothetical protein
MRENIFGNKENGYDTDSYDAYRTIEWWKRQKLVCEETGMEYVMIMEDDVFVRDEFDIHAPFDLNVQRMERERNGLVRELCIVEDPSLRKLVIGDAIGSIVMALLNDKTSRKNINTLDNYLSRFERHKRRGDKNDNLRERFDVNRNYLEQMEALRERLQNINRAADDLDPGGAQIREEQMNEVTMRIANLQRELDDVGPA